MLIRIARRLMGRFHSQRGQAIILFVGLFTMIAVAAAISIDFSLWFSERRGAQKDADAVALAGAFELLSQDFANPANNDFPAIQSAAEAAVLDWADRNGLPPENVHNLTVENSGCFGPSPVLDSVSVDAEHVSTALFASIFGLAAPQIGAHARACVGSIVSATGLMPVGVQISGVDSDCWEDIAGDGLDIEVPLFGQECVLTFGAGETTSGEAGNLRLFNDGSLECSGQQTGGNHTYLDEIESGGANTTCHVLPSWETCDSDPGGCVYPLTGVGSVPEMRAFQELLAGEGECDGAFGDGDSYDDFLETVSAANGDPTPSPDTLFARRACSSPRLVSLIIMEQFDEQGNAPSPIIAFASFFISGCESGDGTQYDRRCDISGGQGQVRLNGYFVNLLDVDGQAGQINVWSPKRIILTE